MRPAYLGAEASVDASLNEAAEQMSPDIIGQIQDAWDALPSEIQEDITRRARQIWDVRGAYLRRFLTVLRGLFARNRAGWQQALLRNRAATAQQLAVLAGQAARLPARRVTHPPGMSPVQVRQYHRRQQARGRVPGRAQQPGRSRESELELELDRASRELEGAEPFWTRVTPIPGIGTKMGHELLTQEAMKGLTELTKDDRYNIETGVIRPDRGGRSYWKFPRAALAGLKAEAQPSHSLRPTPSSSVADAMRLIQIRFAGLHRRAMLAPTRKHALEWLGEALHLLQDSYSSAHTERAGGTGRIRNVRVFFVRADWPPRSRAPLEHNAPSDPRDDIWESFGRLRPQAAAAIKASRAFLAMALRHLKNRFLPTNKVDLQAFIQQYLAM